MTIPKSFIEELKSRVDIVSISERYLTLKRSGKNYFALCPFHKEKTPSFSINPETQIFKCFGCGKSGDVITLVMELEGLNYVEAVKYLADMAGLSLRDTYKDKKDKEFEKVKSCISDAMEFYHGFLFKSEGKNALGYLKNRKINLDVIKEFKLGFAPDGWNFLLSYLNGKGYSGVVLEKAGLVIKGKDGRYYDRFRNRLIIPIFDLRDNVVGFGGRALGNSEPKYLNSSENPLFKKGRMLFGLNLTKNKIKSENYVIVVEGYFDLISLYQNGVKNVVAPLGTSLTKEQVRIIGRYTRNVVINFDPDEAGIKASKRSVEIFLENGFNIKVVSLENKLDPDEYIKKFGSNAYLKKIENAEFFVSFLFNHFSKKYSNLPPSRRNGSIFKEFFPFLLLVKNEVELASYLSELALKMGIDKNIIFREFLKKKEERYSHVEENIEVASERIFDIPKPERDLLYFIFKFPDETFKILKNFSHKNETFVDFFQSKVMMVVCDFLDKGEEFNIEDVKSRLSREDDAFLENIMSGVQLNFSKEDILNCINLLRKRYLESFLDNIREKIKKAEEKGDEKELRNLFNAQKELINAINSIKNKILGQGGSKP